MSCEELLHFMGNFYSAAGKLDVRMIFPDCFMQEYSVLHGFDELLSKIDEKAATISELDMIPCEKMDEVVAKYTEFGSWGEMENTACDYYLATAIV